MHPPIRYACVPPTLGVCGDAKLLPAGPRESLTEPMRHNRIEVVGGI